MRTSRTKSPDKAKTYMGLTHEGERIVFRAQDTPTAASHPSLFYAVGPFRTVRGARFMADHGLNNPHCRTVSEAEQLAKQATTQESKKE